MVPRGQVHKYIPVQYLRSRLFSLLSGVYPLFILIGTVTRLAFRTYTLGCAGFFRIDAKRCETDVKFFRIDAK